MDSKSELTHCDTRGHTIMVDVTDKAVTERTATACGTVLMQENTLRCIMENTLKKGNVIEVARITGIMAAKRTADLLPLCHPLVLTAVTVDLACDSSRNALDITATIRLTGRTGAEMEALTAVNMAALAVYDMCKAIDRGMRITDIRLLDKSGGKSGHFHGLRES